jgi:hypothetical protein
LETVEGSTATKSAEECCRAAQGSIDKGNWKACTAPRDAAAKTEQLYNSLACGEVVIFVPLQVVDIHESVSRRMPRSKTPSQKRERDSFTQRRNTCGSNVNDKRELKSMMCVIVMLLGTAKVGIFASTNTFVCKLAAWRTRPDASTAAVTS